MIFSLLIFIVLSSMVWYAFGTAWAHFMWLDGAIAEHHGNGDEAERCHLLARLTTGPLGWALFLYEIHQWNPRQDQLWPLRRNGRKRMRRLCGRLEISGAKGFHFGSGRAGLLLSLPVRR